jgi:hypothetical protein
LWSASFALDGGDRWRLGWDGVRTINSVRYLMIAMMPCLPPPDEGQRPGLSGLLPLGPRPAVEPRPDPAQVAAYNQMKRQIAAVEGLTYIWERLMWGLCGLLAAVALLSWVTPWGRFWHLLAAAAIFLMTAATLAGARYLDIPDGGGFGIWPLSGPTYEALMARLGLPTGGGLGAPNLLLHVYLIMGGIFSAYGWLLVIIFARRRRPAVSSAETTPPPQN